MKVLIKDSKSGQYLAQHGAWTTGANEARNFGTPAAAHAMLHEGRTPRLLVVLYFEDVHYEVHVRKGHGTSRFPAQMPAEFSF